MDKKELLFPPGVMHFPNSLDYPAQTCWEAACFRNIYEHEELKTLIFSTNHNSYIVTHSLGSERVCTRLVKDLAGIARLAEKEILSSVGLRKGTINPFNVTAKLNNISHTIICSSLFKNKYVFTNDGTFFGTVKFKPAVLEFTCSHYIVQNISC